MTLVFLLHLTLATYFKVYFKYREVEIFFQQADAEESDYEVM